MLQGPRAAGAPSPLYLSPSGDAFTHPLPPLPPCRRRAEAAERERAQLRLQQQGIAVGGTTSSGGAAQQEMQRQVAALQQQLIFAQEEVGGEEGCSTFVCMNETFLA